MSRWFVFCTGIVLVLFLGQADARLFRVGMLPNAPASCNTCHTSGGGTPRNAFGVAVGGLVTPGGREDFWAPGLAILDSDGDGFTNGQELGDPDGDGVPNPNARATRPGDASSFPQSVVLAVPQDQAVAVVNVTQNGVPVVGATVSLSQSVAGVATLFAWSATTNENGVAVVDIDVAGRSASGYYLVQVTDAAGTVIARRNSVPLNGAYQTAVSVLANASASKVASVGNFPNPFNPATQIRYTLADAGKVTLVVYNTMGQIVARLVDTSQSVGHYTVTWDAQNVASGLYYYKLDVDGVSEIRKMMLLK